MALIKCTECRTEISSEAASCPKCGNPAKPKTKLSTWIVGIIFALFFVFYITGRQTGSGVTSQNNDVNPRVSACDKDGARKTWETMTDPHMASVTEEDGWVVVRFGTYYASLNEAKLDTLIAAYANVDACISGAARKIEFRSPSGKLLGRAHPSDGIKIY